MNTAPKVPGEKAIELAAEIRNKCISSLLQIMRLKLHSAHGCDKVVW